MAIWQYRAPTEQAPAVPIDQGYYVSLPHKGIANSTYHTARLTDTEGNHAYLWVHDITLNFEVAGSYAQSHRWRQWYPRNFVQPRITITGQTPNQREYGRLCEWIRNAQQQCQRWDQLNNVIRLHVPQGAHTDEHPNKGHYHEGFDVSGFIANMPRATERWVNAPEFSFEFIVAYASAGVYHAVESDPTQGKLRMAMAIQMPSEIRPLSWEDVRQQGTVKFYLDPDPAFKDASGKPTSIPPDKK